jgi:SAM-dependent methyltransferase
MDAQGAAIMLARSDAEFKQWNEQMMRIHDNEAFHASSNWLVRRLAAWRVKEIVRLLQCESGHHVLDVGCGAGIVLAALKSEHKSGVDLCARMLARARVRCGPQARLFESNAEHLPFESRSFDRVLCSEVIGHVQSPESVIQEAYRVLKPGGALVVTVPASRKIVRIKQALTACGLYSLILGSRKRDVYCPPANDDWYLHHYTPESLKALLAKHFMVETHVCIPSRLFPVHYIFLCRPLAPKPLSIPAAARSSGLLPAIVPKSA